LLKTASRNKEDPYNVFARDILQLPPGGTKRMFPALQRLSLSAVSFKSAEENIASAFDFGSLRSLRIRRCPGWPSLLHHAVHSNPEDIRLKSLEIQSGVDLDGLVDTGKVVTDFLRAFVGLEEYFISTGALFPSTLELWRSLFFHKSTLRKFVHHQRTIDDNLERECDPPDLSLLPEDFANLVRDQSQNPFGGLDLECIGLCCVSQHLVWYPNRGCRS
jgi:hypothetical protein